MRGTGRGTRRSWGGTGRGAWAGGDLEGGLGAAGGDREGSLGWRRGAPSPFPIRPIPICVLCRLVI